MNRALVTAECLAPPKNSTWSTKSARDGAPEGNDARLIEEMDKRGIEHALVPHATFDGLVGEPDEWTAYKLDDTHALFKSKDLLEGYELLPGNALMCAVGGCMIVIGVGWPTEGPARVIAAHAGRDSLIDRDRIMGKKPRRFEGVLSSMKARFESWRIRPHQVEVHGFFSIPRDAFLHPLGHPKWGEFNRLLLRDLEKRYGEEVACMVTLPDGSESVALDMPKILKAQAKELHFAAVGTSGDLPAGFAYTRHPDPALGGKVRNLAILRYLTERSR